MQLERYTLDEMADIVRAANGVLPSRRCRAAHGDGPCVRVVWGGRSQGLALLRGENRGSISVDDWAVDVKTLCTWRMSAQRSRWDKGRDGLTRTRTRSVAIGQIRVNYAISF